MTSPSVLTLAPRKSRKTRRSRTYRKTSVVTQARVAFARGHRLAAFLGFILGGFVPIAVYTLVHDARGVTAAPALWLMVAGGLGYSAPKVWKWGVQAFGHPFIAAAFVLLLEGTVTFAHIPWLSATGLAILVSVNGVSAATALQEKS